MAEVNKKYFVRVIESKELKYLCVDYFYDENHVQHFLLADKYGKITAIPWRDFVKYYEYDEEETEKYWREQNVN